ncbi:heparan-alpha-glucosaminide N-acetyltransferase domain-containing protein [Salinibacterium sp. G-O1]|uniref:heparan-alpha-glucosaminide N-acetyltransferase domain-containing protein n=1 Tax=Salinibacterium sp. G-O1 TaxID=3046208 RepID=UPI0024BA9CF4|nr:heparan-alpha-glucosaminide N-acetyltransferase domain-containing protein [Salinibacterium sp. G-O1]MDJ0334840.1 heparan-alpha-glucosaminide N-acetyltransferase domain-containing protein [Salinibacterium sp. G-O1]
MTSATRIVGIDIARGLAVLGMFGAHVGVIGAFDWLQPDTWSGVVSGRSSILFATLAGVSIAIMTGRRVVATGADLSGARFRIAVRAMLVFVIGMLLVALDTNVAVILPVYAVLFILSLPFLRMPPLALFGTSLAAAIAVPVVLSVVGPALDDPPNMWIALISYLFLTGSYPALIWIVFVLTGLGIGRLDLTAPTVQSRLLVVGTSLAALGYGAGELAVSALGSSALITTEPHSGSPFEVVGSLGFAIAVLGLCLLVSRVIHRPLFPLAAVGSMALSAYSLQIVAIALIGATVPGESDNILWLLFVVVALAAATLWKLFIGKGPFEWLLTASSRGASRLVPADRLDSATPQKRNSES